VIHAAHRRILFASLVGTAVEFYDFYIYATAAALIFGDMFFPVESPWLRQMAVYASFSIAFFARPLGGIVFGHFGDKLGRKSTLVASLMLMGFSTVLIGLLPSYAMTGWVAPVLLCVLRFGQGLGLGGEWGGASLLAVENAPPGWANRYGSFPPMGAPVGFIAANGFFLILGATLTEHQFHDWGWRLPFLASAILVGLGLWVRLKLAETPAFLRAAEQKAPPKVPVAELLRDHLRPTLAGILGVIACFALFYISTVFAIGYGTKTLHYSRETLLIAQLVAILFLAAGIVFAGIYSDKWTAEKTLARGFLVTIPVGLLFSTFMISGDPLSVFSWLALALFTMGFAYGPLGGWLPSLFPARVRYTGVSVTFNAGGIIGGGLTPVIAQALSEEGDLMPVGFYLAGAGLLSLIGLMLVPRETR
jgi:MFS family permease